MEYTAIVKRSGEWWIGWIKEVPGVNCQGRTHEKLRQSPAETLSEALEFNRREALATGRRLPGGESHHCMKRIELLKYFRQLGCAMIREDGRHS